MPEMYSLLNTHAYTKLCNKVDVTALKGETWDWFKEYYESNPLIDDGLPDGYLYDYCIRKFRANELTARCILNGLLFENVPMEITALNQYEKVLIQRVKAF